MSTVTIAGLRKRFGPVTVVKGVDIDVADGEFVALIGPSGCGKSTLLRMIAGLESVSEGDIRIGDKRVNDTPSKDRDIAMVFQSYALYPHMSVADNMGFAMRLKKVAEALRIDRIKRSSDILGIGALLERLPTQLSGGQRQRVAMGRAIVRQPKVFLFDEPLSNLDAKLRVRMRTEIKALHRRLATTTIYVTHDQVEAMTMADKIVVMHDGIVEQIGAPLDLYDEPANMFVAGFLGAPAMNLLPGRVRAGPLSFLDLGDGLRLPIAELPSEWDGRACTLGIRPEHVLLAPADGLGLPFEVISREPTGAEIQLVGRVGAYEIVASVRDRINCAVGDQLSFRFDPGKAHLFDSATSQRLSPLARGPAQTPVATKSGR